jgi:hypothetical protein
MGKERPTELNKKIKRLKESRDGLKLSNREKSLMTQRLRDRNAEIIESRDLWRSHHKELSKEFARQKEDFEQQVQSAREKAECERIRADQERERADKLQIEIEAIWEKKSRA